MVEPVFSAELPRFEIKDGLVYYIMPNGRTEVRTLSDFKIVTRLAVRALDEWAEREAEKVVPLRRKRK